LNPGKATFEEAENHRSQMKIIEEELERYKVCTCLDW
jgi:hypothetical protein